MHFFKMLARKFGYDIHRIGTNIDKDEQEIFNSVQPYTLTSPDRIYALINSVKYVVNNDIPGSIVECGVWRGGSIMAAAKTLLSMKHYDKEFYLFDTFEGMTKPTDLDVSFEDLKANDEFEKKKINANSSQWINISLEEVKHAVYSTGYDKTKFHFVKGKVENTLPENSPEIISILRLDTDWYESTRHELNHLFPRLSKGGVLIIDDYGYWKGARKAVDEYISQNKVKILLNRIDFTGRIGVKL